MKTKLVLAALSLSTALQLEVSHPDPSRLDTSRSERQNCAVHDVDDDFLRGSRPLSTPEFASSGADLRVFIHVALLARWEIVLSQYFSAIESSGLGELAQQITMVAVGNHSEIDARWEHCCKFHDPKIAAKVRILRSPSGLGAYELPTLSLLQAEAKAAVAEARATGAAGSGELPREQLYLYLHTKGVGHSEPSLTYEQWRSYLLHFTVDRFCLCVRRLASRSGFPKPLKSTCSVDFRYHPHPHFFRKLLVGPWRLFGHSGRSLGNGQYLVASECHGELETQPGVLDPLRLSLQRQPYVLIGLVIRMVGC